MQLSLKEIQILLNIISILWHVSRPVLMFHISHALQIPSPSMGKINQFIIQKMQQNRSRQTNYHCN